MMRFLPGFAAAAGLLTVQVCARAQQPSLPEDAASANRAIPQPAYTPLTGGQRVKEFFRYEFSPEAIAAAAASGGIGQWRDRPPEWKEGPDGFGWRFASAYAEHMVRGVLLYGTASCLHEDTRYTPLRTGGFGTRLGHAVAGTFTARHDDGTRHVSIARITAFAGAALISRTWQPRSTDGLGDAAASFGASAGMAMGIDVFREFWPHKP